MGDSTAMEFDRRRFLKRAAVIGGTAWAVPTVVTISPAAAAVTSPPPGGNGNGNGFVPPEVGGIDEERTFDEIIRPDARGEGPDDVPGEGDEGAPGQVGGIVDQPSTGGAGGRTGAAGRGTLPRTGSDIDDIVALGLTASAAGGAMLLWQAEASRRAGASGTDAAPAEVTDGAASVE